MENNHDKLNIKEILKDYEMPSGDELLFSDENEDILLIKQIIHNLPQYDLIILLLYAELGSLRAVANYLSVSHTAAIKKMDQIKTNILDQFYERKAEVLNNKIKRKIKNDDIT